VFHRVRMSATCSIHAYFTVAVSELLPENNEPKLLHYLGIAYLTGCKQHL